MINSKNAENPEISIILPCRNEEKALDFCLNQIEEVIKNHNLNAEVIVSDSSKDSSPEIAKKHSVRLVKHDKEGYGRAYLEGFKHAKGKYIFMADADSTYDFREIPRFIAYLKTGYDLVIGDRFKGRIEKNAMSWTHRYFGTPVLTGILRLFFRTRIHDVNSGMRAIKKESLDRLDLRTSGMEFASEMIVSAIRKNLKIKEVPIDYYVRKGKSKLRSLSDGWRHLRFMLLYSPLFLFFLPGILFFLAGLISGFLIYLGEVSLFGATLFYHPLFLSSLLLITGYQLMAFALFAKTYAINYLGDKPVLNRFYRYFSIEKGSIIGFLLIIAGIIIYLVIFLGWLGNFGAFGMDETKNSILAFTFITLGVQTVFSSFMLSILGIKR